MEKGAFPTLGKQRVASHAKSLGISREGLLLCVEQIAKRIGALPAVMLKQSVMIKAELKERKERKKTVNLLVNLHPSSQLCFLHTMELWTHVGKLLYLFELLGMD